MTAAKLLEAMIAPLTPAEVALFNAPVTEREAAQLFGEVPRRRATGDVQPWNVQRP